MNTHDLIRMLAADPGSDARRWGVRSRLGVAAGASLLGVVAAVVLGLGVRADLGDALTGASGLAKFALAALLAAVAASGLPRAVEPGRRAPVEGLVVGLVVLLLAGIGWAFRAPEAAFDGDPMGCVLSILGLSILPLVAILVALRPGAATRPGTTGALAGIVAGGIAAFGFGLYCPADLGPYVALWYPVAIVACGVGGALVGRWVLAW